MGGLSVEISENEQEWTTVWSISGNQGTNWQQANVDLSPYCGTSIFVRFRGVTGNSYRSDMSVDDITVDVIPVMPCTFDSDCDDGIFCNGMESCFDSICQEGLYPCLEMACNEEFGICEQAECFVDADCNDNTSCTMDSCSNGFCQNEYPNLISAYPQSEGFASDFGPWLNQSGDNMEWTRRNGSTPSSGTGSSSAYEGTYYAYMEASSPRNGNSSR